MKFNENGLVPAIIQDANSSEVLSLTYMNEESLSRTLESRQTWFWSRSRNELWHKGATSGNTQAVVDVAVDCDEDAVLVRVTPRGPACHKGEKTCFHNYLLGSVTQVSPTTFSQSLAHLYQIIEARKRERPEGSYTSYLFQSGLDKILKKVGEEAAETIIAAKNEDTKQFVSEVADLVYHLLVLMAARDVTLEDVGAELSRRAKQPLSKDDHKN